MYKNQDIQQRNKNRSLSYVDNNIKNYPNLSITRDKNNNNNNTNSLELYNSDKLLIKNKSKTVPNNFNNNILNENALINKSTTD